VVGQFFPEIIPASLAHSSPMVSSPTSVTSILFTRPGDLPDAPGLVELVFWLLPVGLG
jgi:hypothetical protein